MARKTLMPWGNAKGHSMSVAKVKNGRLGKSKTDSSRFGMSYPANSPSLWPIDGGKRLSPTAPSEAQATKQNEIINNAYKRVGYSG